VWNAKDRGGQQRGGALNDHTVNCWKIRRNPAVDQAVPEHA